MTSFEAAFAQARARGDAEFAWRNKMYSTKLYEETVKIADLPPTREQIMADSRVMALVGALREARSYVPDHHGPIVYRIDTALAALTDNEGGTE